MTYTKEEYAKSYTEILEIFKYIPENLLKKIPNSIIKKYYENMDKSYKYAYDIGRSLEDQKVSQLTKILLANIYIKYWATERDKKRIEIYDRKILEKNEIEKRKKYNIGNIFTNNTNTATANHIVDENRSLIEVKKKSFFSGVNAKLALATVALTSVMFTSCEKEEFNVAPVELDPASATIAITVYDLGDRSIITEGLNITGDTEVKAGADGKIAPETRKFTATKKDYLPGEGQAVIPALNKGQFAFVPVNIFLQKITDAAKDVYPTPDPETIKPEIGQVVDGGSYTNDSPEPVVQELSYTAYVGQTVTNIDEVKTWIDANIPATKALSNEELKAVLKAAVEGLNTGFTAVVRTEEVTIAPYTTVTLKATTNYQTSVNNVSATVDGVVYNIPGVNIKVALNTTATQDIVSITHDHGHGHGNGNNAGGGNGDGTAY